MLPRTDTGMVLLCIVGVLAGLLAAFSVLCAVVTALYLHWPDEVYSVMSLL